VKHLYSSLAVGSLAAALVVGGASVARSQTETPPPLEAETETVPAEAPPSCLARLPGGYCLAIFPTAIDDTAPASLVNVQLPSVAAGNEAPAPTGAVNIINVFVMPPATPVAEAPPEEIAPLWETLTPAPTTNNDDPLW